MLGNTIAMFNNTHKYTQTVEMDKLVRPSSPNTIRVRTAGCVLRGLVKKSMYERPGPTRHDPVTPSMQPRARLTNGPLWSVGTSLLPWMEPAPIHLGSHCGTWDVHCERWKDWPLIYNSGIDRPIVAKNWCVFRDQAAMHITQVMGRVHLHVRTWICAPFSDLETAGWIALKFCLLLEIN